MRRVWCLPMLLAGPGTRTPETAEGSWSPPRGVRGRGWSFPRSASPAVKGREEPAVCLRAGGARQRVGFGPNGWVQNIRLLWPNFLPLEAAPSAGKSRISPLQACPTPPNPHKDRRRRRPAAGAGGAGVQGPTGGPRAAFLYFIYVNGLRPHDHRVTSMARAAK